MGLLLIQIVWVFGWYYYRNDHLGKLIKLKLCNVGVPVLLGGSEFPTSIGLIMLDFISVEPYETSVESCVGNDSDDRRRAPNNSPGCPGCLAVRYMDFRFRGYHRFLVKLVYLLNL